jgi:hypothetical protein
VITVGDSTSDQVDVRKFARYSRAFFVLLTWTGRAGKQIQIEGLTRDIGAGGMFVLAPKIIPIGVSVHYEVRLPALNRTRCGMRIAGIGQVARLEKNMGPAQWYGLALQFSPPMVRVTATCMR